MNRRDFLASSATLAAAPHLYASAAQNKPLRVGLIGCGWYGKCDLFRLIQVAPVEVVSLCDVDKKMLAEAAEIVAERQKSSKKPRTYGDYREMLKEKDLDIVLIAHAGPLARAADDRRRRGRGRRLRAEADQRGRGRGPGDGRRGPQAQAGRAGRHAAAQHAAPDRGPRAGRRRQGSSARSAWSRSTATTTCGPNENPPDDASRRSTSTTRCGPARPRCGRTTPAYKDWRPLPHRRWWRAFMEYGNGIVGDMCIHMLDMVRWMLDLGWPKRVSSTGGILVQKEAKSNITDTQTATFDFGDLQVVWQHRTWGDAGRPGVPVGRDDLRRQGHAQGRASTSTTSSRSARTSRRSAARRLIEDDKYPEDKTEKDLERHVASAIRGHMRDFLKASRGRGKPVADIEQGHISTASCILANLSMQLGRSLTWDAAKHQVVGDDEANKLLKRPYRVGYQHPAG